MNSKLSGDPNKIAITNWKISKQTCVRIRLIPVSNKERDVLTSPLLCKWSQGVNGATAKYEGRVGTYQLAADCLMDNQPQSPK
jgi:hypothetical protein